MIIAEKVLKIFAKLFYYLSGCLKSGKPSLLAGDVFFDLTCASCSSDGEETCMRQSISW